MMILNPVKWGRTLLWTGMLLVCFSSLAWAQTDEEELINPLELVEPYPEELQPQPLENEELSPLNQEQLRQFVDRLNTQAAAEYNAGNSEKAFEIWYREIRLRRQLGSPLEEVQTLGRVGEVAWGDNNSVVVPEIRKRLETIQQEAETSKTLDITLLKALAKAYEQIRAPGQALVVYEQILADDRRRGDTEAEEATLTTIAQLHMAWFDYPKAALVYEELLAKAELKGDREQEVTYIQELAYIYSQNKETEKALKMKERLEAIHLAQDNLTALPALQIAIASDYATLNQLEKASEKYQEAYFRAFFVEQFAYAGDALEKLAIMYSSNEQPDISLEIYELLVTIEGKYYNYYGLMNAYDQIGQIYLEQKNYPQARRAFEKGLELAKSINYEESHFLTQIAELPQQEIDRLAVQDFGEFLPPATIDSERLANPQPRDIEAQEATLKAIAQQYRQSYQYPQAAATYNQLLILAREQSEPLKELTYLQELIGVYDEAQQPENALRAKQQLETSYVEQENLAPLPALQIAIASDYEALNQLDRAKEKYQQAYTLAFSLQEYSLASDALHKLATLYRSNNQPDIALQLYQQLIVVEQQSYNNYGLMNTYDQMGQIYLEQRNYTQAIVAFQKGLELAQLLDYNIVYFVTKIQKTNQLSSQ
ncbi:MAG: tetratricopeptide repeat protein [Symploca sp. SIO2C1]|nr:tetratricopeptide repeat protein [Symploca sp. SIO2C1]